MPMRCLSVMILNDGTNIKDHKCELSEHLNFILLVASHKSTSMHSDCMAVLQNTLKCSLRFREFIAELRSRILAEHRFRIHFGKICI